MARTDAIVLGAGIVGTSVALHLAKRGLRSRWSIAPASASRRPTAMPASSKATRYFRRRFRPSCRRAAAHRVQARERSQLSSVVSAEGRCPGCWHSARPRGRKRLAETAQLIRPLFARAVAEHEALMAEAGATQYLRKTGWLKVYRAKRASSRSAPEFELAAKFGLPLQALDTAGGAGARAVAQSGVRARGVLAGGGERQQSARRDARLCGAFCRARRRHPVRRCADAAPRRATAGG